MNVSVLFRYSDHKNGLVLPVAPPTPPNGTRGAGICCSFPNWKVGEFLAIWFIGIRGTACCWANGFLAGGLLVVAGCPLAKAANGFVLTGLGVGRLTKLSMFTNLLCSPKKFSGVFFDGRFVSREVKLKASTALFSV